MPERKSMIPAVEWFFKSMSEDYRFQIQGSNPLDLPASKMLLRRFSATPAFLQYVGERVRLKLPEYEEIMIERKTPAFSKCAYLRKNPSEIYSEIFNIKNIRNGMYAKAGISPTTPSKLQKRIARKNLRTTNITRTIRENKRKSNQYLLRYRKVRDSEDQLIVLRWWNSVTPRNPAEKGGGQGGGFLLIWNGYGIAIDPGYDFLENLLNEGFSVNDIDLIIVTHAHDDHTAEIETIYSLDFKATELRWKLAI